jgi:hypothetical protein
MFVYVLRVIGDGATKLAWHSELVSDRRIPLHKLLTVATFIELLDCASGRFPPSPPSKFFFSFKPSQTRVRHYILS